MARPVGKADSVRSKTPSPMTPALTKEDEETIRRVEVIAKEKDWSMSQVALAWIRSKGAIPIVGFNSVGRIEDACGLRGKTLSGEDIQSLEEPYVPKRIVGHW